MTLSPTRRRQLSLVWTRLLAAFVAMKTTHAFGVGGGESGLRVVNQKRARRFTSTVMPSSNTATALFMGMFDGFAKAFANDEAYIPRQDGRTAEKAAAAEETQNEALDLSRPGHAHPEVAGQFTVLTCSSTACTKKRRTQNLDDFETFAQFYSRIENMAPNVQVQECPCLGACEQAPVVAIEHCDYQGTVSLEGMQPQEFADSKFYGVLTDRDADRVWECVENAIQTMAELEDQ